MYTVAMSQIEKPRGPSISDIAADAGVSIATVSRVINASAFVKPDVAAKVKASIDRLGYVKLRSSRSEGYDGKRLVGLLVPDIENPYFASLIKGVQSVTCLRGLDVVLADPGNEPGHAAAQLARLVDRGIRAALVVAPEGFPVSGSGLEVESLRGSPVPVVFMDRRARPDGIHYVGSENYNGAYNAAVYLGSLGHRDILYLAGDRGLSTETERYAGFLDGMATGASRVGGSAPGPAPDGSTEGSAGCWKLFEPCDFSLDKAYRAVQDRLAAGLDFSAIFAADDYMAFGALKALRDSGLRVPEDVSLVGFDDLPFSAMIGLTTVRQQAFEIGVASMSLALDLMDGRRKGPQDVILSTSLIIRGSCAVRVGR